MALTDQELLLLDNFMYMEGSVTSGDQYNTLGELADDYLANTDKWITSDMDQETIDRFTDVLTQIQGNEKLSNLGMGETTPIATDNEVRGRCFVEYDEAGNVAGHVVAFRGTGDAWEAWKDNCEGAYLAETKCQGIALDFVESLPYNDITVTGHSKGGNMAMYVTAMALDKITRCVSYDGQGFGEEFYANIPEGVLEAASEITTSISTHNDYVNILLTPFAGRNICVPNEYTGFGGAHSSYKMYQSNEAALNQNGGYFTEDMEVDRDLALEWGDVGIEAILRFLPEDERALLADLAGSALGQVMGENAQISTLVNNLWGDISSYGDTKRDKLGILWQGVKSGAGYIIGTGADIATGVGGNLKELLVDGKDDIIQASQNAGGNLKETYSEFKDNLFGLFDGQGNVLSELGNMTVDLVSGIGKTGLDLGKDTLNLGGNLVGNAWETVKDFGADVIEVGGDVLEFVGDGLEVVKDGVVEFAGDVKDTVVDVFEVGADTVKRGLAAIDDKFNMPWER